MESALCPSRLRSSAAEQPSAARKPDGRTAATVVWLTVLLLIGLLIMGRSKADPDLWGHVQYGKDVLRDGRLHATTTWSYAVTDHRWINHENLAELIMAGADVVGGQTGLLLLRSVLTLLVLGIPLWHAWRQGAGLMSAAVLTVLLACGISFHWLIRPHMFSYVGTAVLLALLSRTVPAVISPRPAHGVTESRTVWWIPVLMIAWTNAHGGYLAGMAILAAWLGLDAIDLLIRRDSRAAAAVRHHALLLTASAAACLINPYGFELHVWMTESLGHPRPEISEWAGLPLLSETALPFWIIVLTAMICVKRTTAVVRWPGFVLLGLLAWQTISHQRHLPFLAIAASFVLAPHVESIVRQVTEQLRLLTSPGSTWLRRNSLFPAIILTGLLSALLYPRQAVLSVDRSFYPVSALQFMADRQLEGRVLVTFNWAQYALAAFAEMSPESRIAIDGRFRTCYPRPVIDMYFDLFLGESPPQGRCRDTASGPFDPFRALDYQSPDLVLLERHRHPQAARTIRQAPGWTLLYQDSLAELWGRSDRYDHPDSPDRIPVTERKIGNTPQIGSAVWPAFPVRSL